MKKLLLFTLLIFSISVTAQRNPFKNLSEKNGKIGIGTDNPDELLTVKGTIHTQEVRVDLDGAVAPDYVFQKYFTGYSELLPSYEMPTLSDLESFINKNHHLPDVPSAAEMQENGVSLKEMNLILLQKIEELTLYILEQQKQIDVLNEKVLKDK